MSAGLRYGIVLDCTGISGDSAGEAAQHILETGEDGAVRMEKKTEDAVCEKYEFREIHVEEADQVASIETVCFPANEACRPEIMRERVKLFPGTFLVAVRKDNGKIVGFINGLATNEVHLKDEFYTNPALHDPEGSNVMILGVDVLPECRRQGIARAMMYHYLLRERERNRKYVVLTCLAGKVEMYQKFGFRDCGESGSAWGGEKWHEMVHALR